MTIAIPREGRHLPAPRLLHPAHYAHFKTAAAQPVVRKRSAINVLVRLACYFFVFSIPFEMPNRTIPIEIPTITGCVFLLATLIQAPTIYRRIPGAILWFVTWMWVFGLSTLVNRAEHTTLIAIQFANHVQLLLIFWAMVTLMRDRTTLRGVLLTFALACALRAAMQFLHIGTTVTPLWTGGERVTVFGQNANLSAIILSAGFITVLTMRPRLIAWPVAAVIGMAIIQTGSRGGLACAVGGLMVLILQGRTAWQRVRSVIFACVALVILAVGAWQSDMFRARLLAADEGSLAGREHIYPATIEMISEKPWLGWGPTENQYEIGKRISEELKDRRDAHNILLELLSSVGIVGALPFLIGLGLCAASAWRARKGPLNMFPMAFLVVVGIGCISGTWIASKILWFALAVALATGGAVRDAERAEAQRRRVCAV